MVYLFTRNKKTGKKKIIRDDIEEDEARELCQKNNSKGGDCWYEFTSSFEHTK